MRTRAATARLPSRAGRIWTGVGLLLCVAHLAFLTGVSVFDRGRLAADWPEALPWLLVAAAPLVLGLIGLRRPGTLLWAGAITFPLALTSLAGAMLPIVLPGICFLVAYGSSTTLPTKAG